MCKLIGVALLAVSLAAPIAAKAASITFEASDFDSANQELAFYFTFNGSATVTT